MARRPILIAASIALAGLALPAGLLAQMESGNRGIPPIDSSGTLEITGIRVDVGGKDAASARYAGWRAAQRQAFRQLWARAQGRPASEAPNLPDSTLDGLVSAIIVQREQIGPTRYVAELGVQFDRARSAVLMGADGEVRRSVPMLLIPVLVTAGTATSVEQRNPWQRAWAEFRTAQSPIDYVRVSGLGVDPLLVNAAQTERPGRGWWRNIIDLYGAADMVVAEARMHRVYPGGPAVARFAAHHGPDRQSLGSFSLTAENAAAIPAMMTEGARRIDEMLAAALTAGRLRRDPSLNIPEPPPPPEEEEEPEPTVVDRPWVYQVQILSPDVHTYNFAMAHLRTLGGVDQVNPISVNPGGTSYVHVTFRGELANLRAGLAARGWNVEQAGYVLRVSRAGGAPPPLPPQPPPAPPAQVPPPVPTPEPAG